MKFVIASDLHGSAFWCSKLMEVIEKEKPEKILLLGDLLYHGPRNDLPKDYAPKQVTPMLSSLKEKIIAVRGNCEAEVDQMVLPFPCLADYALVNDGNTTFYLTHGHHANPDNLPALTPGTIFLSGHTHVKMDEMRGSIRCVNPGSVTIPKDGSHSCMVWDNGQLRTILLEE